MAGDIPTAYYNSSSTSDVLPQSPAPYEVLVRTSLQTFRAQPVRTVRTLVRRTPPPPHVASVAGVRICRISPIIFDSCRRAVCRPRRPTSNVLAPESITTAAMPRLHRPDASPTDADWPTVHHDEPDRKPHGHTCMSRLAWGLAALLLRTVDPARFRWSTSVGRGVPVPWRCIRRGRR